MLTTTSNSDSTDNILPKTDPSWLKISLLGRDMNRVIIIDNISDNFILQPDNGIFISTWYDDMSDNYLEEISPLLVEIVEKQVPDVRKALRAFRD